MQNRETCVHTYISENFNGEALWDEDGVAELAADVPGVRVVDCLIIEVLLAQTEVQVSVWDSQHF
jgi:hypothetical protein